MKCPISNKEDMIDDCHITIEFGYGSDKDLWTYTFSPVHDEVGKSVLKFLQTISVNKNFNVEDFGRDIMEQEFGKNLT